MSRYLLTIVLIISSSAVHPQKTASDSSKLIRKVIYEINKVSSLNENEKKEIAGSITDLRKDLRLVRGKSADTVDYRSYNRVRWLIFFANFRERFGKEATEALRIALKPPCCFPYRIRKLLEKRLKGA